MEKGFDVLMEELKEAVEALTEVQDTSYNEKVFNVLVNNVRSKLFHVEQRFISDNE